MTSGSTRIRNLFWPALLCAFSGAAIFQFFGNSTRSYIGSSSLFYWWGYQWINPRSETQHGLLILAISVWLVVRNLRIQHPTKGGWAGGIEAACAAMVGGLLLHAVGFVAEQARVSIFGLLLFTWGVFAFSGGRRWALATAFPIAYLVFAIPLSALDSAGFWLRMWVVDASTLLAHAFGIGIVVNGTQLLSPDGRYDYDVAAACSGVRSLVALTALALVIGYLRFSSPYLRAALFALSFPLVYVGNVLRILAIIVAAQWGGQKWGDIVHDIMGYGVFVIVLGGVYFAAELIASLRPGWMIEGPNERPDAQAPGGSERRDPPMTRGLPWAASTCVFLVACGVAALLFHVESLPARGRAGVTLRADGREPVELPTFLGTEWIGRRTEVTEVERQLLPEDTGFSRKTYVSIEEPPKQVFMSIVLSGHDRTSIHRPELCLVAQGWTVRGSSTHKFGYPGQTDAIPATVLSVEKTVQTARGPVAVPQLVVYYFVCGDTVVATSWQRVVLDAWNRVVHARADRWAYVLFQTDASDGVDEGLRRVQSILNSTLPSFQPPLNGR
jgi:exosortase